MTSNKSPLRYAGGKTRATKILDDIINEYFDTEEIDTVVSPFFGGGSVEFYLQNKYGYEIIANDKFKPLYNFWQTTKIDKQKLCTSLYDIVDVSKEDFASYRKQIMTEKNSLKQAKMYFIINRCSFSGATLSGGFSQQSAEKRFTKSSIDRIKKLNFTNVTFSCQDFADFLDDNIDSDSDTKSLIFLDPPYYLGSKSKLYGNNGDMHESFNHQQLFDIINDMSNSQKWIMTYNDCDFIRELYKDYTILDAEWSYGMNKSKKSAEIIILNSQ